MAERKIRIRTRKQGDVVEVHLLIIHPMETGQRTDKATGNKIPPHFIKEVLLELNGKVVATVHTGTAVSEDPLIGLQLKGAKQGDRLKVLWKDNKGESGMLEGSVDVS